jgi:anti-anti-sigma regulatory factor
MTTAHMSLPSTLTQAQAASVAGHLEKAIADSQGVFVLDTSAIQSFDSSALAVLVGACRAAASHQVPLQITGLDIERHLIQCGERATGIGECFRNRLEGDGSHGKLAILRAAALVT